MKSAGARYLAGGPPPSVLTAFQISQTPARLSGGQGQTWSAGAVVLKPIDDEVEALWLADFATRLPQRGFRIALPIGARDGRWIVEGWSAWTRLEGERSTTRWAELLEAASAFHAAARSVPKPEFIERRGWSMTTPLERWGFADQMAWGEVPVGDLVRVTHVERLLEARREVELPSQLVHGDLAGNVLFAEGMAPAIIDLSLYRRPVGYSAAIVVADALTWEGAPQEAVHLLETFTDWPQLLLRAVLFRVLVSGLTRRAEPSRSDADEAYARLFPLVLATVGAR